MAQTAVCNRHHSVEQQLCRWLLLSLDRLPTNELSMTQELIANMLGVRREGVTEAAGKLQQDGLIHYSAATSRCWTAPGLESAPASATRWSRPSTTACCRTRRRPEARGSAALTVGPERLADGGRQRDSSARSTP